jgi:Ca2+-binding EF-hand superfamily protein
MDVLRNWLSNTGLSIAALFDKFDTNGDGMIDSDELREGLLNLNLADLPPSQVERLIEEIDIDGNGEIDLMELEQSVTGAEYTPSVDEKEEKEISEVETSENDDVEETKEVDDDVDDNSGDSDETEEESEEEEISETETGENDDSEETEEEVDDDSGDSGDSEESIVEFDLKQHKPDDILELLISIMDEQEANPADIFHVLDEDGDKFISSEEFSNTVKELLGDEDISESSIADFIASLDTDKDGNIDIIEFISAIEKKESDSEKTPKEFPTPMQAAMMSKKWNDIWWPLIHAAFFAFILIWVVNGLGIIVDGSGGSVALETSNGDGSYDLNLSEGDIYPCDADIQVGNCANSLTPFSGDSSSMPKGFYADGIFFMLLGAMGMVGSMFTHLVLAKGWRARVKASKEIESDTEDAKEASEDESDSDEEENDDSISDEDASEEEDSEEEGDDSADEEDGDSSEDDIDIGSHIGLTIDEEEYFGVIIEFDDEDELVTIKEDGSGDEITGYQDEMFLE